MVYTKKLKHSHWEFPINCDPAGFISPITDASVFLGELSDKLQNMNSKNANHLMHPALTDILSAYRSETADVHDDIMRKLRKLNSLENKQTSGS